MNSILAAQSTFSIGTSIITVEKLIEAAKELGEKAVALTDTMSITGMIDFTNKAKKAGIKPIIGCRLRLVDDITWRKKGKAKTPPEYQVIAYVLKEAGIKTLFRLLSLANDEDHFYVNAKLSFQDLFDELAKTGPGSLAIATGDVNSIIQHPDIDHIIRQLDVAVGAGNLYLTLTPINTPYWDALNIKALSLMKAVSVKPLVTRPTWYNGKGSDGQIVMNALCRNTKLHEPWHWAPAADNMRPLSMVDLVKETVAAGKRAYGRDSGIDPMLFGDGIRNTEELVGKVEYEWKKAPVSLPKMAPDEFQKVVELCKDGFRNRLVTPTFGHQPSKEELASVYRPRLAYELEVLGKLGFSGYFLLVHDIVSYAKSQGILVGPGRGSVGGSLVAYLMGITDCDPLRFELLFERFINPDRIDLPDADLDFMSARRGEIVDYLVGKFGATRVAGISNFNSLAAASAIRDVGKACGLSEFDYQCSKYAEKHHGQNIKLKDQLDKVPEIKAFSERFPQIWEACLQVEGAIKSMGRHAAGVVVGGVDLIERGVVERRKDGATINWDKRIVEDQGLVKVDILGLETLDLIKLTCDYIWKRHTKRIDLMAMPLDDAAVLENFARGKTTGIFQFESGGMRRLLKELGKDGTITFDDITAATALYRPGPMDSGMMDSYWKRKQGLEEIEYDHPNMVETLKPTYGVMVYQEQVMRVAREVAGYSMADADKLRKIMGKKLPEEMKKERGKFVEGCIKTVAMPEKDAGDLFDKIEKFAGYGFNKSHSVEYTLISYQAMWLKTNYPVEFYAAALSLMKEEKLPGLLADAQAFGISIEVPDINISTDRFEILTDRSICIPFGRVKGLSENAARSIVKAREDGKGHFKSIADLQERVERRIVNKAKVEILDKIGAFSRIEPGQLPARHPDRIRDQREFIPGLISDTVPISRGMCLDKASLTALKEVIAEYQAAHRDDGLPITPHMGRHAKFMVIADAPTSGEERQGKLTWSDSFSYVSDALSEVALERADGYWTSLIKRPKEGKQVTPKEIALYQPYLAREIAALKPPIIVLLGSAVVRHFLPDFKGKASDAAGKVVYSKELDANLVIGFNPGEIYHDGDKQNALNEVFAKVVSMLA